VEEVSAEDATQPVVAEALEAAATVDEAKTESVAPEKEAECVEAAQAEVAPARRLRRCCASWELESAGAQLGVKEGDFVCVWPSTVTEHGWIYAEDPLHAERAGWLPDSVLEELASNERWMKAVQNMEAAHESQLSVVEGSVYKVNISTRTKEGWIYVEASGAITGNASEGDSSQAGWVPVFCFAGADLDEQ
jgi:hypothetical protein